MVLSGAIFFFCITFKRLKFLEAELRGIFDPVYILYVLANTRAGFNNNVHARNFKRYD